MTRELSDCQTFSSDEEGMPEPETDDFYNEIVQNSLKAKKKGYAAPIQAKPVKKEDPDDPFED